MSCFLVPLAEAIVTTVCRKSLSGKVSDPSSGILLRNLPTLEKMLWGGSILLIVDHILNGELTWAFPFLTALGQKGGGEVVLHEVLAVGVPMALVATAVWALWSILSARRATGKA